MDRISELKHHPTAQNLLLSISDDHGNSTIRLYDLETGAVLKKVEVGVAVSSTFIILPSLQ